MKLALVHISDIHFKSFTDVAYKRAAKLANVINFSRAADEHLAFVITGDIAFSGHPDEYAVARSFFDTVFEKVNLIASPLKDLTTFIPGNHDCNFQKDGDLRPRLLKDIQNQLEKLDEHGQTARALLEVHSNFFAFCNQILAEPFQSRDQLFGVRKIEYEGQAVELRCFNSAWLSQRHERIGSLGFPTATIAAASAATDSDVVISLVHHPANWMNAAAAQAFKNAVQSSSDFLVTGHEHHEGGQIVSPFVGSPFVHIESGALQPENSGDSAFGIIHIDLDAKTWCHDTFTWSSGSYTKQRRGDVLPLFDKKERRSALQLTKSYLHHLRDPGTGFLHPRQQSLVLSDIYVYPDLKTRTVSKRLRRSEDLPAEISSQDVVKVLLRSRRVVVAGPTDCGKTALSKMLYVEGNTNLGRSCLLLCGDQLKGTDPQKTLGLAIDQAIEAQYGSNQIGHYEGLDVEQRVLIIDDWDSTGFNREGRALILDNVGQHFGCVLLFVDDVFLIEEVSGRQEHSPLRQFEIADIREFGFRLRGHLVRKWHSLGNTFIEDEQVLARNIADSTRVIDTVLGRNLLPAFPVNVLALLQTYDAGAGSQNSGLGSYGQVYEALITARLAKVSVRSIDIGTKITILSRAAWLMFDSGKRSLSKTEWQDLGTRYFDEYKIRVDTHELLVSFVAAGILIDDEGEYRFTYGYGYCYFVAKYFQENLADLDQSPDRTRLSDRLRLLSQRVYKQDNASIIIFYVFLTKDRSLIYHVIANARLIFHDMQEFDFDSHANFVNKIISPIAIAQLPDSHPDQNTDSYNQRRDESGEQLEPRIDHVEAEIIYGPTIPFQQKLIIGIRYLNLMGQILRNFPGSLKADTKLELAFESYALGLRILGAVFKLAQDDAEGLTEDISMVLRNKMAFSGTDRELREKAELIIAEMLREIAFSLLKRMSHAVGLKELDATYDEVSALRDNSLASRLIQLSIRLDHFEKFPKSAVEGLAVDVQKNTFSYQTLRDLVMNHLYLFPTDYSIQQWAGSLLQFKVNIPKILGSSRKMLKG